MVNIFGEEINSMEQAKEKMLDWFEDKCWDIWLEQSYYGPIIYVESIDDPIKYNAQLHSLTEVRDFCENDGLGD